MEEITIKIDGWTVDVFTVSDGNIGFTVYEKGKGKDEDSKAVDIFVDSTLNFHGLQSV